MLNIHNCSYHSLLIRTLIFFGSTGIICGPSCLLRWLYIKFGKTLSMVHAFGFIPSCSRENKAPEAMEPCFSGLGAEQTWPARAEQQRRSWSCCGLCVGAPALLSSQDWAGSLTPIPQSCSLSWQRSALEFKLNSMKLKIWGEI